MQSVCRIVVPRMFLMLDQPLVSIPIRYVNERETEFLTRVVSILEVKIYKSQQAEELE